jgi:hypothetical protein
VSLHAIGFVVALVGWSWIMHVLGFGRGYETGRREMELRWRLQQKYRQDQR